jgi:hypothetical protein
VRAARPSRALPPHAPTLRRAPSSPCYREHARAADTFNNSEKRLRRRFADGSVGPWAKLIIPDDSSATPFDDQLLITLRTAWGDHKPGTLLAAPTSVLAGTVDAPPAKSPPEGLTVLFAPSERVAMERGGLTKTRNKLIIELLDKGT